MKKSFAVAAIVLIPMGGVAVAQHSPPPPAPGHGPGHGHSTPSSTMCPMMGGTTSCGGMMSGGGTMSCGGMMSGGGMMAPQSESPRMLQMRGQMLKEMGEVMVKYGKSMETTK